MGFVTTYEYSAQVAVGLTVYPVTVIAIDMSMDADRVPYVQAQMKIAYPGDAAFELLDPRRSGVFNPPPVINFSITATQYDTGTALTTSQRFPAAAPAVASMWVLDVDYDMVEKSVTLGLSSGEFLLDDKRNLATTSTDTGAANVQALVTYALTQVGKSLTSYSGTNPAISDVDSRTWHPGDQASNLYQTALDGVDGRLWCDEQGLYRVNARNSFYPAVAVAARDGDGGSIIGARMRRSRTGRWYDGQIIKYDYTDSGGARVVNYWASSGTSSRDDLVTESRRRPGTNAATPMRDRAAKRGEFYDIEAVPSLVLRPGATLTATVGGVVTPACRVRAIDWRLAEGLMTLRMETSE